MFFSSLTLEDLNYIDVLQWREERRRQLSISWFFDCECIRCQSNDDDIVMQINSLDVMLLTQFNDRNLEKMLELLETILGEYSSKATTLCMKFLKQNSSLNQRLLEKAKEVITVTLGEDHPLYRILTDRH